MTKPADPQRPTFLEALQGVAEYSNGHGSSLTQENINSLAEIRHRLQTLDNQLGRLLSLNSRLMAGDNFSASFDPATDTFTVRNGSITTSTRFRRADPNVPAKIIQSASISAYQAGSLAPAHQAGNEPLRLQMEELLEGYYHGAHRVLKLVQALPQLAQFTCREITIIRNKLVEHPERTESYSFGYGSDGPVIRPMHTRGRKWIDAGLLPNTEAFITALKQAFPS